MSEIRTPEVHIEQTPELDKLLAALAKAQSEMKPAPKNALNPAFARGNSKGSKYADLADCVESIRPPLSKNGLSLLQIYGGPQIVTMLGHESGQWIRGTIKIPNFDSLNPQQIGSATTYLRRYSLGIVGLVTDEDDDGNAASGRSGVTTVDPRGDLAGKADPKQANAYAERFKTAMNADMDEPEIAAAVYAIHTEVSSNHELYIDIANALGSKYSNALKKYVEMHKKAHKAAA